MCGRFSLYEKNMTSEEFEERFGFEMPDDWEIRPAYNISPYGSIPVIFRGENNQAQIRPMQWQLVPSFAKEFKSKYSMFNTRVETFEKQGFWPRLLQTSRCIIPANNFFEWAKADGQKIPYKFELKDQSLMGIGGIYSIWRDGDGNAFYSTSMITVPANDVVGEIHSRMPFILPPEFEKPWLDKKQRDINFLKPIINPYPPEKMQAFRVSQQVNNSRNDSPDLITPLKM